MRILHISAECFPVAKVGGLADVVGSLPKYQNKLGVDSEVVIPYYTNNYTNKIKFDIIFEGSLHFGNLFYEFQVLKIKTDLGFPLFLVKIPGLLDRENVYGYEDDTERFMAFQIAILDWIMQNKEKPTIIHHHDHHTGLLPFMLYYSKKYKTLKNSRYVF